MPLQQIAVCLLSISVSAAALINGRQALAEGKPPSAGSNQLCPENASEGTVPFSLARESGQSSENGRDVSADHDDIAMIAAGSIERVAGKAAADSPLARKEHPRLLLTRDILPELRHRARTAYEEDYRRMVKWADDRMPAVLAKDGTATTGVTNEEVRDLLALSFLWQVTREPRYADAARRLLTVYAQVTPARAWTDSQAWRTGRATGYVPQRYLDILPVAYDLLHDAMGPEQRAAVGKCILDGARGQRNVPGMGYRLASFLGMGKAAGVLAIHGDGVDDQTTAQLLDELLRYVREDLLPQLRIVSARRGAWIESLHCGCFEEYHVPFFWFLSNATGHNYFQDETVFRSLATWYVYNTFRFGTGPNGNVVPVSSIDHGGVGRKGNLGMPICAAASGDGLGAWLVRQKWWQANRGLDLENRSPRDAWYKILFYDPRATTVSPEELPETALFEGIGWVSMRSSWRADATFAHFKCGHWRRGEPAHLDNNSFYIYKHGPLAIDGINPGVIDDPAAPGTREEKLVPYGRMTIAHNTVTVYDPAERIMGVSQYAYHLARNPFPVNDGGQTFRSERTMVSGPFRCLDQGRIIAYQTHRLFDYVCGDATDSYSPSKLKHFSRQFVFLKPDCFVIFDRVVSTRADYPKHWLLHSYGEPQIASDLVRIDAPGNEADRGRLFVRTLLPRPAKIEKYPRGTLVRMGKDITPAFWKNTEDSWRIEVEPAQPQPADLFLHVLQAADARASAACSSQLIDRGDQVGAVVTVQNQTFAVTFNQAGPIGGHIRITEGDKALVDKDLVDRVQDTYEDWKGDRRHGAWTTNPQLRSLIGLGRQGE